MGGGAHPTHVTDDNGPMVECTDCHGSNTPPMLADGQDLANTTVCDNCHSADGVSTAKTYWPNDPGTWITSQGESGFCGSCHDETPGNTKGDGTGDNAPNIVGDGATYGFYVNGHGKASGNYQRLSWQDTTATGNPAANRGCSDCHDLTSQHFNNSTDRLKSGYENDSDNTNCNNCHISGIADNDPQWYTTSTAFETSAHNLTNPLTSNPMLCTDCHDVHGSSGNYPGMTIADQESLCYQCHTEGVVQNNAISGATLADDIQQAFGFSDSSKHNLGTGYTISSSSYSLECVSCHNVHIVTGKYWEADQNKSPITRISTPSNPEGNLEIWGDESGEKMNDYGGTYRTPGGDPFTGDQLPNYTDFCEECHETMPDPSAQAGAHGNLGFDSDPHGLNSANSPNGGGTCPDRFSCGKAQGWDGDDCTGTQDDCWPVMTRGKGDQLWSRPPYNHEERITGANFALSCTDCHEAHGSSVRSLIRTNPNNGTGTTIWNTMCNNCHYYYSDWHDGMSCGNASCHVSDRMTNTGTDSIHRMANMYGDANQRTFNSGLVLDMRFEGDLSDSGTWRLHGKWMDDIAGSFTNGKSGQAVVLDGGKNIQVGTRDDYWSTDDGKHGTWKYTEMKHNTTLEAWVYPTADQDYHSIFTKHVGYVDGGYEFALQKINGALRAVFYMQADNNGFAQDGRAGVRGAHSSVSVPLNKWTHVAVTFDTGGPDRDPSDPSVGRIRIYVNGEDVTTSDPSGNLVQPGSGETSIFAYSENSPWNESICYNGDWCASEFSIGGFYGWQNEFVGYIDEAKVWNVTKDTSYFSSYDSQTGPYISTVEGLIGSDTLTVTFSEGVYANTGAIGDLQLSDFTLTDTNGDNPRTITAVTHTAGDSTATITMSAPLIPADVGVDTLAAVASSIYDEYDNAAGTDAVTIVLSDQCPTSPVSFPLNDPPGSSYIMDTQNILYGVVNGTGTLTGSEYSGGGDGSGRYIMFDYNSTCLQVDRKMTLEARIKPTGIPADTSTNYIRRIFDRASVGNYQMSVWRNEGWTNFTAPSGEASIALWVNNGNDDTDGAVWNVVLTNYTGAETGSENECPIVSDHWYQIKAVWDSDITGAIPAKIYIDDQGTDGADTSENWAGMIDCTDADQSLADSNKVVAEGWEIKKSDGNFAIGANRNNPANNLFNGLIDWINWKDTVN
jgi:predicted CXXCH cytochrome family protein